MKVDRQAKLTRATLSTKLRVDGLETSLSGLRRWVLRQRMEGSVPGIHLSQSSLTPFPQDPPTSGLLSAFGACTHTHGQTLRLIKWIFFVFVF